MARFSANPFLDAFVEKVYARLVAACLPPIPESFKEIPFGVSFKVVAPGDRNCPVTIYHSDKKGFSIVTGNEEVRRLALSLLVPEPVAGCDEAGKGDLFGPLVTACFYLCDSSERVLSLNIRDSKRMSDAEVLSTSDEIMRRHRSYCEIIRIMPQRYNELYAEFRKQGKTLNHLLAWAHTKAISGLVTRHASLKKIIVDQFSDAPVITDYIRTAAPEALVEFHPRAESHPAVAVASVIARAAYLGALRKLSEETLEGAFVLKSGSGPDADRLVTAVRERFGHAMLSKIAKTHFVNLSREIPHDHT